MSDNLTTIIKRLRLTTVISSQPNLDATLADIERYGENEKFKAYFLGHFFKRFLKIDELPAKERTYLINTIKQHNLEHYFYLKKDVDEEGFGVLFYILTIGGVLAIVAGIYQLYHGDFWYGLGTRYLLPVVREGGYKVIAGIGLLVGGLVRLKYEKRKSLFFAALFGRGNNIA